MDTIRPRVIQHYRELARRAPQYTPVRMAELAKGVVEVEDKAGECDALFNKALWRYTMPEIWEGPEQEMLDSLNLAALEGAGTAPVVCTIEDMVAFAKRHLSPKGAHSWYDAPQFFDFK